MRHFKPPQVFTDALPTICQAKSCLNDAFPGYPYCEQHLKRKQAAERRHALERSNDKPIVYGDCTIYFIQAGVDGPIKIGMTKEWTAARRLNALQTSNPEPLVVLAEFRAKAWLEPELHALLRAFHIRGEWFKPKPPVLEVVAAANRGVDHVIALTRAVYSPKVEPDD